MNVNAIEELLKSNAKWLKDLSHDDCVEARKGIAAGLAWGENDRSLDAVKAVVEFFMVASDDTDADGDPWDSNHDAAFDHYHQQMENAVGNDDADFEDAQEAEWGDPFQMGWFRGVCEAFSGGMPV